ncbi:MULTISPECIES: GNAT family N-acetyltransferase [Lonsdalea]|uniref:Acetyltransferase n=2 Tax=Lonsdalea TaxID=1082702 RepID=A0ACD1JBL7_9GAMM|nr:MULTISPECIES: N-acetyltransferase [Lonsdalea]OSM99373.1 acetyltransferase [Lonsdalea populi]QPQ23687.1 N-acetyltransferase [Lonsdalea populi]RAT12895.1 acetyltransferase [Lonsdalea quercina]RAT16829.1 acetyltransferase [Lonsdalea quercina]RAT20320.1 acetyltransferase [Lonsdalea populi]
MLIRVEIPVDAPGIDRLLRYSFPTSAEAELVQALRENGQLTLGMVATDDEGGVVGYAAFSPVSIEGEELQWVGLAPLAVDESLRKQGLGEHLVYAGLDSLNEFGYAAVVVFGDPAYFSRFGFVAASEHQLCCCRQGPSSTFQIYPLADNHFQGVSGKVAFADPFNRI